jgi:hypothetical protein
MKKLYILVLFVVSCVMLSGCTDWIELEPKDTVANENFFKTQDDFDQAVTGLYSMLRPLDADATGGAYFGNLYWEVCADVCVYKNSWTQPWFDISRGELKSVTSNLASLYRNVYAAISWANTILQQIADKESAFPGDFVNYIKGQAHFVRAICYIRLTSLWGPVPMIDRLYLPSESKLPRSSVEDITNKLIIPDLEIAAQSLEMTPYNNKVGLATKQSAMGMKVRAYLYNKDYENTVKAAEELMELDSKTGKTMFLSDYKSIFDNANENNSEILFSLKYVANGTQQGASFNTPFGGKIPGLPDGSMNGSWETISILPEFIDSYPLTDGKTVAEGSAVYDADNKWANRGARFESTFYIGGYSYVNGILFDSEYVRGIDKQCTIDYPLNINKGYMNEDKKTEWMNEDESDFILLRYTDVLMMYAEAKTMLGQIDQSVFDILDAVRDRAGIAHVPHTKDPDQMLKIIQDERKWEFAFEGLRYFDIRRWGIAADVINSITSDEKYNFGSHKVFVAPANYLWPLPQEATDANPNLLPNNEGY